MHYLLKSRPNQDQDTGTIPFVDYEPYQADPCIVYTKPVGGRAFDTLCS